MHARVVVYQFKPGTTTSVIQRAEAGFGPLLRGMAGFDSYELVRTGPDSAISISRWQTQAQAGDAVKAGTTWVAENLGADVVSAQTHVGEVAFSHRA